MSALGRQRFQKCAYAWRGRLANAGSYGLALKGQQLLHPQNSDKPDQGHRSSRLACYLLLIATGYLVARILPALLL